MAVLATVVGPFIGLIVAVFLLWGRGVGWTELALMCVMYAIAGFGVTVGFHRQLTHKSFDTYPWMRALLGICGSVGMQGPVIKWCAIHRRHHQMSDRHGDPHSPNARGDGIVGILRGIYHSHIGWLFDTDPDDLGRSVRDLVADRGLLFVDRTYLVWVLLGLAIPTVAGGLIAGSWTGALTGLIWGGLVRLCLMHHVTWSINSVCHIWGTRPYRSNDDSRNNPIFGVLALGEGWHNNHHAFPTSARHGLGWWQFDSSYLLIRGMQLVGLAWNVRVPSRVAMEAKRNRERATPRAGADASAPA
jgi:stearoyl-CoA desaturase (delta-9 desaturase)